MDAAELDGLAASIREHGVLQPILVTETLDGYQLVAGERRVRAGQLAGLERIPAVVRQLADRDQLELALVENLQRADLGPDRGGAGLPPAHRRVRDDPGPDRPARRPRASRRSRTRSACSTWSPASRQALARRSDDARAMPGRSAACATEQQARVARSVVDQAISVRQTEELVRRLREPRSATAPATHVGRWIRTSNASRRTCVARLGTKVDLARSRKGGRIVIEFYSDEELGQLYDRLIGGPA